ncbi:MAG: ABC transporter ATP-binding protein [Egibacteraceae bacterium]
MSVTETRPGPGDPAARPCGNGVHPDAPPHRVLSAHGLAVGYRQRRRSRAVLSGLDLDLRVGQLTCLLGANGSGKTTLLRTLSGSLPPLAGRVCLGGADLAALSPADRARRLAVVLTSRVDAGLLRVEDLVALGRHPYTGWSGRLRAADHEAIDWALEASGATALRTRPVPELSDGERQRVMIARALAQEPEVLMLDEPTAFVDLPRRLELAGLLTRLARECGLAVLLTSHDLDLALRSADDVWLLGRGGDPEAPVASGAPEDLALSGALAAAFDTDTVRYDPARGRFEADGGAAPLVAIDGEGPEARWATHAIERAGFAPTAGASAALRVAVEPGPAWRLDDGGAPRRHRTLAALVADLRACQEHRIADHHH